MRLFALLVVLLSGTAASAQQGRQPGRLTVGATVSEPLASMADAYDTGLGLRAAFDLAPARALGWQIGLEATRFGGRERRFASTPFAAGVSVGATVDARFRLRGGANTAYGLVGLGAFHERAGDHAPYPIVPEAHLGLQVGVPAGPVTVVAEARVQAVLSDLLSGSEYTPSLRVPLSLGVRF